MFDKFLLMLNLVSLTKYKKKEKDFSEMKKRNKDLSDRFFNMRKKIAQLEKNLNKLRLSNIDKLNSKKLKKFSFEVRKVGACDICSSKENLTAHHLWSKSLYYDLAYHFDNGICLCEKCHNAFHQKYNLSIQVTPKRYEIFKNLCKNQIILFGKLNYENL